MVLLSSQIPTPKNPVKDITPATFMAEVVEASRQVPVIVDFWAPWCGPCKTLGPIIEKAVQASKGAVRLVKMDVEKYPQMLQQMRIQSIPAVYAFFQGQVIDGFIGALPESQVKQFIERLIKMTSSSSTGEDLKAALVEAKTALENKDLSTAAALYSQILQLEPEHPEAYTGLIRVYLEAGQLEPAQGMLSQVPAAIAKTSAFASVKTALELALSAKQKPAGLEDQLQVRLQQNPEDHQIRFDLAMAYYSAGQREQAIDTLLDLIRRNRTWNDDAARKQLVKIFEALGPTDPLTISGRRRLSSILFS